MKYLSWYDSMAGKHSDDLATYVEECLHPDLGNFLDHQLNQYQRAVEAEALDYRYEALLQRVEKAQAALDSGEQEVVALAFCRLGQTISDLQHPSHEELEDLCKAALDGGKRKMADFKRGEHNRRKQAIKEHAQQLARELWNCDEEQSIRISDMANKLWPKLVAIETELGWPNVVPDRAERIVVWLREVAPSFARKPGRPKN